MKLDALKVEHTKLGSNLEDIRDFTKRVDKSDEVAAWEKYKRVTAKRKMTKDAATINL